MEVLAAGVRTLCCGALVCGVLLGITGTDGPGGPMRRMLCGMFLVLLAVSPLRHVDFTGLSRDYAAFSREAEQAARAGADLARQNLNERISQQCSAYILDQARELGASLRVRVEIDPESHLPRSAAVSGRFSPEVRNTLSDLIARELGIERSCQQWNQTP